MFMEMMHQPRPASTRPTDAQGHSPHLAWGRSLRWLSMMALIFALAVPMIVLRLHPSLSDITRLALCLILSGATSVVLAAVAGWFAGLGRPESVGTRVGTLILMGVLVISVNVVLLARLLFASSRDMQLLLTFVAFGIAVALAVTSPIARRISYALGRLELGAGRIAAGEHTFRIAEDPASGAQELEHLASAINQMADGIQQASAQQQVAEAHRRQTITAVSHDLRTPVSAIQAMVEAIADGVVSDPATVRRYHETLRAEVDRLSTLLDELFELTRLESGAVELDCDRTCIGEIAVDAVEAARERAERTGIHLTAQIEDPLPDVCIDGGKIHRAMNVLLDNALRYTPPGGSIIVHVAPQPRAGQQPAVLVQVIDTGRGIAPQDLAHVFEPTYRAERSRARQITTLGATGVGSEVGLGLTLAAYVLRAHGGQIWVDSPLPPAARAFVALADEPSDPLVALVVPDGVPGTMVSFTLPAAGA
jgi:signal transduction histidine kinase